MKTRIWFSIAAVCVTCVVVSRPTFAGTIQVFVAYADNLRPSGFFPSLWLGSPNVVSQSSANQTFDSGAIRIDNTGTNPITITDLTVTLNPGSSPIVYSIWNPLTIGPGQTGIFTQNNGNDAQFDTSDSGVFGAFPPANLEPNNADGNGNFSLIGGCSSLASFMTASQLSLCSANAPIITFDENGTPMSFTNTGQVLNTGGWDFVNNSFFGEDGNESINWNTVSGISRGGTPEPGSLLLFATGILGLSVLLRVRRSSTAPGN